MPVEFNPKSLRSNDFSYKNLEVSTPLLPISPDVVKKTVTIFNLDVENNKYKMELEMMADQPNLHEYLSFLVDKPHNDTKAYREGSLKTYMIFTNQAYEQNYALPKVPKIDKSLYENDFDLKFTKNENMSSLYSRVIRNKLNDIYSLEPGLNQPLTSRENYGPYKMSFGKGVVDTYYAFSKTINGKEVDNKFGISQ